MEELPLVSCIMPTYNRRAFVPRAIRYFLRQDYEARELIIVDDGTDPIGDLIPAADNVRYIRLDKKTTIGSKRNLACVHARGSVIAHWDDDDWHAPHRLRHQMEALLRNGTMLCGINHLYFYDVTSGRTFEYVYPPGRGLWFSGSTLCYTRAFWALNRFADVDVGEDTRFIAGVRPEQVTILPDSAFHVGLIHGGNVSPKYTAGAYWHPYPLEEIRRLLGSDWDLYQLPATPQVDTVQQHRQDEEPLDGTLSMMTVARQADLALPEFAAFNHGQAQPRMRRWELPFALFQARLSNTMSVLDCTINPVNFQQRLTQLYPDTLYRRWNPIQGGQFVLPVGVPDEAFDRVICINTLEHLLEAQREALIASMARKLKPRGCLVLTSDYYFDSSWGKPAFLQAGVMRADRQEVFNGFNKVTQQEWIDLCSRHDLHPMGARMDDPREDDAALYCQQPPFPHACIAGVFCKAQAPETAAGKKVVLALLTWNTRDISIESARAYIREANMLRRLGQVPYICICDNGSTDGTKEALQTLENTLCNIPHKCILNPRNVGSSIARNQIIDYTLECDADYVLFMDGDVEIVAFSSFAMLRHMENNGHRLGCVGAYSSSQTTQRGSASAYHYCIDQNAVSTTNLVAWTQYGMFSRAVFEAGIRFDEAEPFGRPGWGFEDNDLAFQMDMAGFLNQYFTGMVYLHRSVHSSIGILRKNGDDPTALCRKRQQYLIQKWTAVPQINNGPLVYVRRAVMP